MLRDALRASPVHFGASVLYLMQVATSVEHLIDEPALDFADTFLEIDIAESTNALHVIASTTSDELQAARIQSVLATRRQPVHPVVRDFGQVEVVEVLAARAPFADGEHVAIMLRWPDGTEATIIAMITYGGVEKFISDAFVDEAGHEATRAMLHEAGGPELAIEQIPLGEAGDYIAAAALGFLMLDPDDRPETESWPALDAFLAYVVSTLPAPEPEAIPDGPPFEFATHRNTPIALPAPPDTPWVARLRVELEGTEPLVWRELDVRSDLTLDRVSDVILESVGWQNSHLHRFWPGDGRDRRRAYFITEFDEAEGDDGTPEAEVRLDQVLREPGDALFYEYDFGDSWGHLITLLSTRAGAPDDETAVCTGGERRGPLEDVGGVHGHNELVEALAGPQGTWGLDAQLRDWVPERYDPTQFDLDTVNGTLQLISRTPEEVLAAAATAAGGALSFADGLDSFLDRLPPRLVLEVAALVERAVLRNPPAVSEEACRAALGQVYVLLEEAKSGGIPLTPAGWIKPDVVKRLAGVLGVDEEWRGKNNREEHVRPLHWLRAGLVEVGLLRKVKGRIELTTNGIRALGDPALLVHQISSRIARSRNDFDREARSLFLLHLAAGETSASAIHATATLLDAAGWNDGVHRHLSAFPVYRATDHTRSLLGLTLHDIRDIHADPEPPELLRLIARDAVIHLG